MAKNRFGQDLEDYQLDIEASLPSEMEDITSDPPEDLSLDDTGLEIDDSEDVAQGTLDKEKVDQEINDESDDLMSQLTLQPEEDELDLSNDSTTPQAVSANPQLNKYQQYLNEYKKLQDQRRKGDLVTGLIAAGGKIGQSIAGKTSGNFTPDQSGIQMLQKMDERPVQDYEQGQVVKSRGLQLQSEMASHDPNSPQSGMVRDYIGKKLGMQLGPDVSAADAQMLLKTIGRPNQQKAGQVVRTFDPTTGQVVMKVFDPTSMTLKDLGETAGFALQPRVDPRTNELMVVNPATGQKQRNLTGPSAATPTGPEVAAPPITRDNLTAKQQDLLDKSREKFLDDSKDDRAAVNAAQGIKMTIAGGKEIGGDILREIQNQLARGSGEKGAMTDRDVAPFGGRQDVISRVQRAAEMSASGQLPDEDREFLMKIADVMEQRAKNYVANKSDFFVNNMYQDLKSSPNLKGANFNPKSIRNLIGVDSSINPSGNKPSKQVIKKGYNKQTNKTQLIYDDGSKEIVDGQQ